MLIVIAAASIIFWVACMLLLDRTAVLFAGYVPFFVNVYLGVRLFERWQRSELEAIQKTEEYRAAMSHLTLWVLVSLAYMFTEGSRMARTQSDASGAIQADS